MLIKQIEKYFKNFKFNDACQCICGEHIKYLNVIQHKNTNKFFVIGSDCIYWWKNNDYNKGVRNTQLVFKAMSKQIEIPKFCSFCYSTRICINCKDKKNINNIF